MIVIMNFWRMIGNKNFDETACHDKGEARHNRLSRLSRPSWREIVHKIFFETKKIEMIVKASG